MRWTLLLLPCLAPAFVPSRTLRAARPTAVSAKNPNDLETEEERRQRMEYVRQVQRAFYSEEKGLREIEPDGTLRDVPLWRVQWTELPGFQNVLNVWQPHYTHMFMSVVNGPRPWYFGHVHLPGGTESLNKTEYRLEKGTRAPLTGVLMQVGDYKQLDDGRLVIVVQALERMEVVEAQRHVPYSIATIRLAPDEELVAHQLGADAGRSWGAARAAAVAEALHWHPFEVRSIGSDLLDGSSMKAAPIGVGVSPLAAFDVGAPIDELAARAEQVCADGASAARADDSDDEPAPASPADGAAVPALEYEVWVGLDALVRLLMELNPQADAEVPVPTQMLGLVPRDPPKPWPLGFYFDQLAARLDREGASVGTYSQAPFVHVPREYPARRRAQRLSFAVWVLLDPLVEGAREQARQPVLETKDTASRLRAAIARISEINAALRTYKESGGL